MAKFLPFRTNKWSEQVAQMDAERDAEKIVEILIAHVFTVDMFLATEMAQLRTFTIPTISKLLHHTRQYEHHSMKRLDDTKAILLEMGKEGITSATGAATVEHLNQIHGFYKISNDDYLYTLSTFIFDARIWLARFGWRQFTDHEQTAIYHRYRIMGEAMHIQDIPATWQDFWAWRLAYEERAQGYAESNQQVALGLLNGAALTLPKWLRPAFIPLTVSLFDKQMADNLRIKPPNFLVRGLAQAAMRVWKFGLRVFNPWEERNFTESALFQHMETYPNGYELWQVGPENLVKHMYPHKFENI